MKILEKCDGISQKNLTKYLKTDSLSQNYGLWLKISQSATSRPIKAPFIVIMVDY